MTAMANNCPAHVGPHVFAIAEIDGDTVRFECVHCGMDAREHPAIKAWMKAEPDPVDELVKEFTQHGFDAMDLTPKFTTRDGPIWECKIGLKKGTIVQMPGGSDSPMRDAVEAMFKQLTGLEADFNFSGWGAELNEIQQEIVDEEG